MARTKKKSEDLENSNFIGGAMETIVPEEEIVETNPEPEVETVSEPEPETAPATPIPTNPNGEWDLGWELGLAHSEIQHCLDYTEIPGADYKGYFRGKLKEWRMYAYKVRQYSIHGGNVPQRPEPVEDRY